MNKIIKAYGLDIINSKNMNSQKTFMQHGKVSIFEHSLKVAYLSLVISRIVPLKVDERSLVRGALLHDYFLYDWHVHEEGRPLHGFYHPKCALMNAEKEFILNNKERDIIYNHMFPLTIRLPKYRETVIVSIADKISAIFETLHFNIF